jgi:hypothetical protein
LRLSSISCDTEGGLYWEAGNQKSVDWWKLIWPNIYWHFLCLPSLNCGLQTNYVVQEKIWGLTTDVSL